MLKPFPGVSVQVHNGKGKNMLLAFEHTQPSGVQVLAVWGR